jgi:hypothetical protein|tara:strand:+ start:434 stop:721 length:288 start_codon:yes stop_codon:yes gene_type:complete
MPNGILSLRHIKNVLLSPKDRHLMSDKLQSLFSNDWLESLTDDQLYDVFEEFIELPGLSHIGYQKPVKPRPDSNIYDLPITDEWWNIKPEPEEEI